MEDFPRETDSENECGVTVNDGAWMTCDMIETHAEE
jgi:hypothetical protein